MVQGTLRRPGDGAGRRHLRRRRPRDHRRQPCRLGASPRSARSRCAPARCSASSRPWSTPTCRSRPSSRRSPASRPRWWPRRRASSRRCPRSSSSPRARSSWPTTPGSTSASSRPPAPRRASSGRGSASSTRSTSPAPLVTRDEARNHKLSTLAMLFGSTTTPDHRALHDARATVDVLHALIERVGSLGVHTLEELSSYTSRVSSCPAPQALAGRRPARRAGRLPLQGRPGARALRRHLDQHPGPGPPVLHRLRAPHPDGRDGAAGRAASPRWSARRPWRPRCASCA